MSDLCDEADLAIRRLERAVDRADARTSGPSAHPLFVA